MKKHRLKIKFLEELGKTPIVSAVCGKLDLSRQTVYRWLDEDPDFKKEYDICLSRGRDNINDLAESKLINKIQEGQMGAIVYWLDNKHKEYIKPRQPQLRDAQYQPPMKFYIQTYQPENKKIAVEEVNPDTKNPDEPESLE